MTATLQRADEGQILAYQGIIRDITQRKQAEEALKKLSSAVEQTADDVIITDKEGLIEYVNPAFAQSTGYTEAEVLGQTPRILKSGEHGQQFYKKLWQTILAGEVFRTEFVNKKKNGELYYEERTITPIRDPQGNITHFVAVGGDITERKRAEQLLEEYSHTLEQKVEERTYELSQTLDNLRSTQSQLVEAEKMAALGQLVAGIAHEINTPVGVGVTASSLLEDKTTAFRKTYQSDQMSRSDLEKYLDIAEQSSTMILKNLNRAAELIQSFKQVAVDQSSAERREFPVKTYLEEILLSLRPKLKRTQHTIQINGDDDLTLNSYPGAFSQIVTNLVMNSLLHAYKPDEWGQLTFDFKQDKGRFIFEYADDGRGIEEENLRKIFEPFFTTKRGQGGSGLGLHIIYNLVTQKMAGAIRCESAVGVGTRFIIEVPLQVQ